VSPGAEAHGVWSVSKVGCLYLKGASGLISVFIRTMSAGGAVRRLMLVAVLCVGCRFEDRGFGSCVFAGRVTLEMRDRLACAAKHDGGFPQRLDAVLDSSLDGVCGSRSKYLVAFAGYAEKDGADWIGNEHRWRYSQSPNGRVAASGYGLAALDQRTKSHYISYWVDQTGVLRAARGGVVGPGDKPDERQSIE
jgi:hypothetical protein